MTADGVDIASLLFGSKTKVLESVIVRGVRFKDVDGVGVGTPIRTLVERGLISDCYFGEGGALVAEQIRWRPWHVISIEWPSEKSRTALERQAAEAEDLCPLLARTGLGIAGFWADFDHSLRARCTGAFANVFAVLIREGATTASVSRLHAGWDDSVTECVADLRQKNRGHGAGLDCMLAATTQAGLVACAEQFGK